MWHVQHDFFPASCTCEADKTVFSACVSEVKVVPHVQHDPFSADCTCNICGTLFLKLNLKSSYRSVAIVVFLFSVSGLLLVVVHSGEKLLSMDEDGFSDPYCVVAANKEKVRFSQICVQFLVST